MAEPERNPPRGYMRRTYHLSLEQRSLQDNWSLYRKQRHRAYKTVPAHGARAVDWTDQVVVICARCRRSIGKLVAFESDDRYGIVEDTHRRTIKRGQAPIFTGRANKHPPWLWVDGDGASALAHFHCPRCRVPTSQNAHRLGQQIVQKRLREVLVGA